MLMRRRVFALIPARGGSKGVHKKNLRLVKGHSLVERAILSAIGAVAVDMTYLSSDDDDILNVGRSMGIAVYKRESRAADDAATADDVVLDFITRLPKVELENDPYIVYLQPTSPFRTSVHIDNAFREMGEKKCTTCISVISLTKSPYKSFILTSDGLLKPINEVVQEGGANAVAIAGFFHYNVSTISELRREAIDSGIEMRTA